MKPTAKFVTITPNMAKTMLEKNKNNRPINDENLNAIINELQKNRFKVTGESIKVSKSGNLLDGQHRLLAIVKSDKPQEILLVEGLDEDAFKYIDTGRTRKASDVLAIEGVVNSTKIAGMVKFIISFKNGRYSSAATNKSKYAGRITNADVSDFVFKNRDSLFESYPYGFNKENKLLSGSLLSSFHFIFKGINENDADDFCHKLSTGENISKDSPIHLLRQKLLSDIRSTLKMTSIYKIAIICKAWNLYRKNTTVSLIKWDSTKEPFPKPI